LVGDTRNWFTKNIILIMAKPISKVVILKYVTIYATYLIVVWTFYRFLFRFPDEVEELVIKPVLWLGPIIYLLYKEKANLTSIGITIKNLFSSLYLSLGLGAIFVIESLIINYVKYGGFNFGANIGSIPFLPSLGLSFVTAFSEEISFRGYIFGRLLTVLKNDVTASIIQTVLWTIIHVPIAFFVLKLDTPAALVYLFLTMVFGIGSAFIFTRTKNVFGSILLHVLWEWPIILFR
jgi:membrane protease YdiL (CAAX protease family)